MTKAIVKEYGTHTIARVDCGTVAKATRLKNALAAAGIYVKNADRAKATVEIGVAR